MSHRAVELAFQTSLPHLQKHVLMALAYRHNHLTGQCDPARETIAQDCGMSKSSVKAALRSLQVHGLIEATQRKDGRVHISNFLYAELHD
jgi:DNA-binding MarR family transcriptional regulator